MSLIAQIQDDMKSAMLAKDQESLSVIRMLKSAIKNYEVDNPGKELSDGDVIQIVQKQLKQRQDAADEFKKANRDDLAEKELKEAEILKKYMPEQISDEELEKALSDIVQKNSFSTKKDFGSAMKEAQLALSGKADNKRISQILNRILT